MQKQQPKFDAPIAGMSLTGELGAFPWQTPPEYATVEEAMEFYLPRLNSEEVTQKLISVMEMGVPLTVIANTMQLHSVMQGLHTVDVGILVLPVLIEMLMLIGDSADIDYNSGIQEDSKMASKTASARAVMAKYKNKKEDKSNDEPEKSVDVEDTKPTGLMARRQ